MIVGNSFSDGLDNVHTFAAIMQNTTYVISHSCLLFPAPLFLSLLTFYTCSCLSTVRFISLSFLSTVTCIMWRRRYVLVPLHTLSAFLIASKFQMKKISAFLSLYHYGLSVLSINVVTVLFINCAVLLKRGFTRKSTCLCEITTLINRTVQ